MKYLKRFNEDLVNREELKDFCEMYLAYLLDDGKITIDVNDDNIIVIQNIFKRWDQIKDHFIPFIEMLDKSYNISEGSSILLHTASGAKKFTKKQILNDIPESLSNLYYIKIDLDKDKVVNESFDKESLTDLCDMCLAYIMDDGYEYDVQEWSWLDYKIIKFDNKLIENKSSYWPYRNENFFKWSDVKDQIIPFLEMLSRKYRIMEIKMDVICEYNNGTGVEQKNFMEYYISSLIDDRLDDNTEIKCIEIKVAKKPKPKKGIIGKIKSLFEAHEEYKSTPAEVKNKLESLIPDTFSVKVRPILHKVSGIPNLLEVSIRKPNSINNSRSVNYNINEVLPAIEEVKELLDGRYKLTGINGQYYHGILSQYDNQEALIDFVTNKGRVNSGKYTFTFSLIKFETKKLDEDFPLEELFACCSDEGVRITKKTSLGFLTINILLNEVSQYDDRFRYFDDIFYRQIGDAIHQCIHYYKFRLAYIQMDGSTEQNVFNGGTKFRTLEEWEALPKAKLYNGHKLKLNRISINFEL